MRPDPSGCHASPSDRSGPGKNSPDARRRARADASTRSPSAGPASRASTGYVVFVRRRRSRRPRARRGRQVASAATPRPASVELLEPSPDRVAPLAAHPGAPWQVLPYERQLEVKHAQVDDALRRLGRLDGFALEPIVPALEQWRYRNKLEYSFGERRRRRARVRLPRPGPLGARSSRCDDCLLASEDGQRRAREVRAPGAGRRASTPTTGAAAMGCCAISSCARAGAPGSSRCAS